MLNGFYIKLIETEQENTYEFESWQKVFRPDIENIIYKKKSW